MLVYRVFHAFLGVRIDLYSFCYDYIHCWCVLLGFICSMWDHMEPIGPWAGPGPRVGQSGRSGMVGRFGWGVGLPEAPRSGSAYHAMHFTSWRIASAPGRLPGVVVFPKDFRTVRSTPLTPALPPALGRLTIPLHHGSDNDFCMVSAIVFS